MGGTELGRLQLQKGMEKGVGKKKADTRTEKESKKKRRREGGSREKVLEKCGKTSPKHGEMCR